MRVYEKDVIIPLKKEHKNLIKYFSNNISTKMEEHMKDKIPIRFAVTKTDSNGYYCDIGILEGAYKADFHPSSRLFDFKKREYEKNDKYTAVFIIPTGIDAELGGYSGDACSLAKLVGANCDTLITHPNAVNAADINEMSDNTLYVEGSILSRLMMGTIGLQKVRQNHLEIIVDKHPEKFFEDATGNSVSAARTTLGISAKILKLKKSEQFHLKAEFAKSGRVTGSIENLEGICNALKQRKGNYNAVGISSLMDIPLEKKQQYYAGKLINPWGGGEAIFTHALSFLLDIPSAHSPMKDGMKEHIDPLGIVDPRMSAESVSVTYFHCVLKGLNKSPKIITNPELIDKPGITNASDINCLITPDNCIGLPLLAALEQEIPVIAVKNKNIMQNNLEDLPWKPGQLIKANNYLEALGCMRALKQGISIESLKRPLKHTEIIE